MESWLPRIAYPKAAGQGKKDLSRMDKKGTGKIDRMTGLPERNEAAPYYFNYIDLVTDPDIISVLEKQVEPTAAFLRGISEEKSLYRYAPDKWSIRQAWSHVNDAER